MNTVAKRLSHHRPSKIDIRNITGDVNRYRDLIDTFLHGLDREKTFFNLTTERVIKSHRVMIALERNRIIGISGLERKYGFLRSYVMLGRKHQGRGLAKLLYTHKIQKTGRKPSIVMGIIDEKNYRAIRLNVKLGYRFCGKRGKLLYFFRPLNPGGTVVFNMMKIIFPAIRLMDSFRR
jgi:hypothetical protein